MTRRTVAIALQAVLLVGSLAATVLTSRAADWQPLGLFVVLLVLAITSDVLAIQAKNLPGVLRCIVDGTDIPVIADSNLGVRIAANGRGDKNPISPNDRTRMPQAGDRRFPADILACLEIPGDGWMLSVGHARAV